MRITLTYQSMELGEPMGLATMGWFYESGTAVTRDEAQAARLYHRAANQNQHVAMYQLGLMYAQGRGVAQDQATAVKLLQRSAQLGNVGAQKVLKENNISW